MALRRKQCRKYDSAQSVNGVSDLSFLYSASINAKLASVTLLESTYHGKTALVYRFS